MTLDKEEHRQMLLELVENAAVPVKSAAEALELLAALRTATVAKAKKSNVVQLKTATEATRKAKK